MYIVNWPICRTTTPSYVNFPWGPALWERMQEEFFHWLLSPSGQIWSPGVLTLLFFWLPARTRAPAVSTGSPSVGGEEARSGQWWGALYPAVPAGPWEPLVELEQKGEEPEEVRTGPSEDSMQSLKEGENRHWGSLTTFCHTLFPWMTPLFISFQQLRNLRGTRTAPLSLDLHLIPNISVIYSLLSIWTTTLLIRASITFRGDKRLLIELLSSFISISHIQPEWLFWNTNWILSPRPANVNPSTAFHCLEDKDKTPQGGPQSQCGLAPHCPLFQPHLPTFGLGFLKLQAATGPLHMLCPVLAILFSYPPSHLEALRAVTFSQESLSWFSWLGQTPIIYVSSPGFPKRQTKYVFCISGISETRSLLIFRKMLISKKSSWERQDFLKFHYSYIFFFGCATGLRDLSSPTGIEPVPSAVKMWSPNHWTTGEFPYTYLLILLVFILNWLWKRS